MQTTSETQQDCCPTSCSIFARRTLGFLAALGLLLFDRSSARAAGKVEPPAIIPLPVALEAGEGSFVLTADSVIVADKASLPTAAQLAAYLQPATGFSLKLASSAGRARSSFALTQDKSLTDLGMEGYQLDVTPRKITLTAPTQAGLFYTVQTLRQLLPPQIFSTNAVQGVEWQAPCVKIRDFPRFGWRGLMLDSGHDFQSLSFVLRFIDLMALHKLNTLHWHITDLGTWPLEIKNYPKLLDPSTRGGVKPGYYTQEQVRQVVRYAAERHITVVPEIDMPGHSVPALIAYPEFDCPVPGRRWEYCVGNEKTYGFLQDVLSQVIELFPSTFIHIGGDECPKDHWKRCPICQARMKAENLKDETELQSYFTKRIEKFLNSKGRRLIGWDEILEGSLAPNASVMSWRGTGGGIAAAKVGHDVVMAPTSHLYFDYAQTADRKSDPQAAGSAGPTTLQKVYSFEPIPKELTPEQARHILGAQAQMWTDTHPTERNIEWLVYPRACALSEVVWSPATTRDYSNFTARLAIHEPRLAAMGVNYRPLASIFAPVSLGVAIGEWAPQMMSESFVIRDWDVSKQFQKAGPYALTFVYNRGAHGMKVKSVVLIEEDKEIAKDLHEAFAGGKLENNVYHLTVPQVAAGAKLKLKVELCSDEGTDSEGTLWLNGPATVSRN